MKRSAASTLRKPMMATFSGEFRWTVARQTRQWHAMHIAAGAGFGCIHVGVRVDPYEADFLALLLHVGRHSGDGAYGDGMVAAEYDGELVVGHGLAHTFGDVGAGFGNLWQITRFFRAWRDAFRLRDIDVAEVFHRIAKRRDLFVKTREANGGRAHVDAAAPGAQVHGRADNGDVGTGIGSHVLLLSHVSNPHRWICFVFVRLY
jgi:hypothetical protein